MRINKFRKAKRLWKLYKELQLRRKQCKTAVHYLEVANKRNKFLKDENNQLQEKLHRRGHVLRFTVPQENVYLDCYTRDMCANAHYAERRVAEITDAMKIQLVNDLLGKGYMKKCDVEPLMTTYELVINEE